MATKSRNSWVIPLVAIVSLCGLFTWQLGVFNMGGSSVTTTGWAKIRPQLAGTGMGGDGTFSGVFTNGAGTRILVDRVDFTDQSGRVCYGDVPVKDVAAGDNFRVTASGCGQGYVGDVYNVRANIVYSLNIGGITTTHTETGTIRGPFESTGPGAAGYQGASGDYAGQRSVGFMPAWGYGSYGPHRSFDFGAWWIVVIALSIAFILDANRQMSAATESQRIQLLGLYGFIFILCSTLIFVFGVDHLFNGQDNPAISLRFRYGWMIESLVYLVVGLGLTGAAEYGIRREGAQKTILPPVLKPLISLLAFSLMFIYPYRAVTATMNLSLQTKLVEFGWVAEVLVLSALACAYWLVNRKVSRNDEAPEALYVAKAVASLYFIAAAGLFIWGVNTLIYSQDLDFRGVLTAAFIAVGGVALFLVRAERKKTAPAPPAAGSEDGGETAQPRSGGGLVAAFVVVILLVFVMSRGSGSYLVLLAIGGVCGAIAYRLIAKDEGKPRIIIERTRPEPKAGEAE
jgi:hypothetical protein